MAYVKTILCLANSKKHSGRCIAGREPADESYAGWIRPVSTRPKEELSSEERRYKNGEVPRLLDFISIPLIEPRPKFHQIENHLIDTTKSWRKVRRGGWSDAVAALHTGAGPLWVNGDSSYNGINDRAAEAIARELESSLLLIRPMNLQLDVGTEGAEFGNPRRVVRAHFRFNKERYKLAVTDPDIMRLFAQRKDGFYPIAEALLCVSLGEIYGGFAYKLVAAVLIRDLVVQ